MADLINMFIYYHDSFMAIFISNVPNCIGLHPHAKVGNRK